jgi:hypothetical protein
MSDIGYAEEHCSSTRWKVATYGLGLITIALVAGILWTVRTSSSPDVALWGAWLQQTRSVNQPGASLSLMYERNQQAVGMAEAGRAMLGRSGSTATQVATDLNTISGSLSSILAVTRDRQKVYPAYTSRNMRAIRLLLSSRILRRLPSSVRSQDDLARARPTLDSVAEEVQTAAGAFSTNVSSSP